MVRKYKCPVKGCNFIGDSKPAVQAHIVNQKDPEHKKFLGPGLWDKIIPIEVRDGEIILVGEEQPTTNTSPSEESVPNQQVTESKNKVEVDIDLLELTKKVASSPKISTIENKVNELESVVSKLQEEIETIKKRLDVHKESILKILEALGIE